MSDDITQPGVPFSLVCENCDNGLHIDSYEQAIAEGWTDICYSPDTPMANYVGLCPDCREES
jgi:hypothetical protein